MEKSKNIALRTVEILWSIVLLPLNIYIIVAVGVILLCFHGSTFTKEFTPKYFKYAREVFSFGLL